MEKMEKIDRVKEYYSEARNELKKVTWPTRQQTLNATWVVILISVVIGVFLGVVDFALSGMVKYILR
ncbi:MAG: preprotein translocase subunit SecE [Deltaproteobacteria bacterium]|nr:preprotein translocase subunit SecE [Deltaproteobacteria bacterium]